MNQESVPDGDRLELCGETAGAWLLSCCGFPASPLSVLQAIRGRMGEPSVHDGTTPQLLLPYIEMLSGSMLQFGPPTANAAGAIMMGRPGMLLAWVNDAGDLAIDGQHEHWLATMGGTLGTLPCMNPWGGRWQVLSGAILRRSMKEFWPAKVQLRTLTLAGDQADAIAAGIVEALYLAIAHRVPESDAAAEGWAAQLSTAIIGGDRSSVELVIGTMTSSPEFAAALTRIRALMSAE